MARPILRRRKKRTLLPRVAVVFAEAADWSGDCDFECHRLARWDVNVDVLFGHREVVQQAPAVVKGRIGAPPGTRPQRRSRKRNTEMPGLFRGQVMRRSARIVWPRIPVAAASKVAAAALNQAKAGSACSQPRLAMKCYAAVARRAV